MDERDRANQFHTTIYGGQQALGSDNANFVQHNYASPAPAEEFAELLSQFKEQLREFADPDQAGHEVRTIEDAVAAHTRGRTPVLTALQRLDGLVTAGTNLAKAVAKAIMLVSQHWPF
jgi:hypothetical protein